ncbi:MAG TPA: hypothetical protein VL404_04085 [Candidatus Eisenbacteria bacterium]|nr:hypothetical protein [Candidatus Eisenbacteria bacterium]
MCPRPKVLKRNGFFLPLFALALATLAGCGPKYTYPADTIAQSIEKICKDENQLDVKARVVGKTVGAVLYLDKLIDEKGQIPKEVHEKMGQVMQAVTRVALSTDAPVDFCMVSIRERLQANELVITRSLDDTKRANADAIGIEESINRTLFGQGRYSPEEGASGNFVLNEVKIEKFLADQIVQRVRFNFSKDSKDDLASSFALVDGAFETVEGKRVFRFSVIGLKSSDDPHSTILNVFKVVNDVLSGYKFLEFDSIEIQDYLNRLKLTIDKSTLLAYQQKKLNDKQILERFVTESQSIQEAFKLFGFNLPQE